MAKARKIAFRRFWALVYLAALGGRAKYLKLVKKKEIGKMLLVKWVSYSDCLSKLILF
jgi:hypothetical protein